MNKGNFSELGSDGFNLMFSEFLEIKNGTHKQFVLNSDKEQVECRCGHKAVWYKTGYLCGTITAYPCKFNLTSNK